MGTDKVGVMDPHPTTDRAQHRHAWETVGTDGADGKSDLNWCKDCGALNGKADEITLPSAAAVPPEALRQLVEKWRTEAAESLERWPRGAILPAKKLRQCADELEAVLQRPTEEPTT